MHSRSKNRTEKEENAEILLCDTNGINAKSHIFLSPTIRGVGGRGRENPSKSKIKRVSVRRSSLVMELIPLSSRCRHGERGKKERKPEIRMHASVDA